MKYIYGAVTEIGIGKSVNQDCLCVMEIDTQAGRMCLALVCDGMGGFSSGELASATVMEAFRSWAKTELALLCTEGHIEDYALRGQWEDLISRANQKIYLYGINNSLSLGTTLAAILVTPDRYYAVNIGDSRIYKKDKYMEQITMDHSLVFEEYLKGKISKNQVEVDPRNNVLTRSVGICPQVAGDYYFGEVCHGITFFLCTDGVHHVLTESYLDEYLATPLLTDRKDAWERLVHLERFVKSNGELDDLTLVTVAVNKEYYG